MINVDINLGKACNNACQFCSNGRTTSEERRWSKVEDVEREICARAKDGVESIGLLGGEPTLYPHLERLVARARAEGIKRIAIITNGSRLSDPDFLDRLLAVGVTRVALSLHSHLARIEDAITDRPGSFAEKVRAMELLAAAQRQGRLPDGLSLNTVLHGKISRSLEPFTAFVRKRGLRDIRFNFIRPTHRAEGSRAWVPALRDVTKAVRRLVLRNETEFQMGLNFADFPLCKMPWEVMSSDALRQRYVGELWDLRTEVTEMRRHQSPTAPEGQVRFAWKDKRMEYKTWLPTCDDCSLRSVCEGIWNAYLDIYGEEEFQVGPAIVQAFGVRR